MRSIYLQEEYTQCNLPTDGIWKNMSEPLLPGIDPVYSRMSCLAGVRHIAFEINSLELISLEKSLTG